MDKDSGEHKYLVAMSGGVDSSVAAMLMQRAGHEVLGVSMQVWDYRQHGGCDSKATCCSPDDFTDARKVAAKIGIPYYVFDFEKTFRREVIDRFVATYERGLTPNPCIDCNSRVKFKELRDRAYALGCHAVVTGHFARIKQSELGYHLLRGRDKKKDQSYFLYGLTQSELGRTVFPVGNYTKDQVRDLAAEAGLVTASKPESQDICFISGSVAEFIVKIGGKSSTGPILNTQGEQLGSHSGVQSYTVGQRRGIGVGGATGPLYVIDIDAQANTVTVGSRSELEKEEFRVVEVNWVSPSILEALGRGEEHFSVIAQMRYRHDGVEVDLHVNSDGTVTARFKDKWSTVSPGQAAVFYDEHNEEVLGGGRIAK